MRYTLAVVVLMFILIAGLALPAVAGDFAPVQSTSSSSTAWGWSIPVYIKGEMKSPAGRIAISFSHRKYGDPEFWYIGSSREVKVSAGIPAFSWCIARIELTGAYAGQIVKSDWENVGSREDNTFGCQMAPGAVNNAVFYIQGREKKYLCIPFFEIPIGSSGFTVEQSFRVYCQNDMVGLTSYESRLQTARMSWPDARFYELRGLGSGRFVRSGEEDVNWQRVVDLHELYALFYVFENQYLTQGMVIAGTERMPCNDSASLRDLMEVRQGWADEDARAAQTAAAEAEYQRKLAEAEAARRAAEEQRAADAADYQRRLAQAEAARLEAENRLANPPAPVTTTTTETTTEVVQPRPEVPVTLCSWRLNLPAGKVVCVETLDQRGERRYPKRYSGHIPFNNYVVGQDLCVRLTWEGKSQPDPWKVVRNIQPDMTVNYTSLEVR